MAWASVLAVVGNGLVGFEVSLVLPLLRGDDDRDESTGGFSGSSSRKNIPPLDMTSGD